ncbi:MAG: DUF1848 domain-containing protein [Candidatus Gastranaerophilales bacterium]|nr:DUF1848 domain-containing protein [Candidatus Gastranaerophilales bacterium]
MIINTGGRTDTVQYYSEWLLNRFSEGYVLSRNPLFPNKVTRYELTPDMPLQYTMLVDCPYVIVPLFKCNKLNGEWVSRLNPLANIVMPAL